MDLTTRWLRTLVACLAASACSPDTPSTGASKGDAAAPVQLRADGTSEASLNASLDAIRGAMSPAEIETFTDALMRISTRCVATVREEMVKDPSALTRALCTELDGKTADQILAAGAAR